MKNFALEQCLTIRPQVTGVHIVTRNIQDGQRLDRTEFLGDRTRELVVHECNLPYTPHLFQTRGNGSREIVAAELKDDETNVAERWNVAGEGVVVEYEGVKVGHLEDLRREFTVEVVIAQFEPGEISLEDGFGE